MNNGTLYSSSPIPHVFSRFLVAFHVYLCVIYNDPFNIKSCIPLPSSELFYTLSSLLDAVRFSIKKKNKTDKQ